MEEGGAAAVLPGPSQPTFCRPAASTRRLRKSGSANIFQGVNLQQLRRLFRSAGEPDAEQRARQVWRNRRGCEGEEEEEDEEEEDDAGGKEDAEEDEGLAQALVGLRVRARTRCGIRAEAGRGARAFGHSRMTERPPSDVQPDHDRDGGSGLGACGGPDPFKSKSCDPEGAEDARATRKDPDRYLHRIRH